MQISQNTTPTAQVAINRAWSMVPPRQPLLPLLHRPPRFGLCSLRRATLPGLPRRRGLRERPGGTGGCCTFQPFPTPAGSEIKLSLQADWICSTRKGEK